jgi:hypothetical protein
MRGEGANAEAGHGVGGLGGVGEKVVVIQLRVSDDGTRSRGTRLATSQYFIHAHLLPSSRIVELL